MVDQPGPGVTQEEILHAVILGELISHAPVRIPGSWSLRRVERLISAGLISATLRGGQFHAVATERGWRTLSQHLCKKRGKVDN